MYDYQGKTVLVTGGSMGIGEAFASAYARRGADLVLVARDADRLATLAAELRAAHGVRVDTMPGDLTVPGAARALVEAVHALGRRVDVLVNNAGFAAHGEFTAVPVELQLGQVDLNVRVLVELTHLLLPEIEARRGGILQIASTAAFQPIPRMAVYGASKAFVLSFSEALWAEYRPRGVRVLAVCPGATDTPFFARAGEAAAFGKKARPEAVVRAALTAFAANRSYVVHGAGNYFTSLLSRFFTREFSVSMTERVMRPRPLAAGIVDAPR